MTVEW